MKPLPDEVVGVVTYLTLSGHYGWACNSCGAESRYVYTQKSKARRLGQAHEDHCRHKPLEKAARR